MSKVWFITGTSKGFGRIFTEAALNRGDKVVATARDTSTLDDFVYSNHGESILPVTLDVTDADQVTAAVQAGVDAFGRLDIVVNNAGYGLFGMVEEITEQQLRAQFDTNLFGAFNVTQAVLPIMREQESGHIIQISTIGGVVAFPGLGGYHASKWALEGLTESLAQEVAGFGIKVTLIEPGGFATDWAGASGTFAEPQPQYDAFREAQAAARAGGAGMPEPVGFGSAILKVVDADDAPRRVFFGELPTMIVPAMYQQRLDTWEQWKPVSLEAEGK
jgi:NAD(P)-dependent dehydrogenase (short-subunit alcohol dehydrogenase family)